MHQAIEKHIEENKNYLIGLWAEILGTEAVSASSDFFELGGNSLHMMTMLFRISQDLGVELSPGVVFELPTPDQLAIYLSNAQSGHTEEQVTSGII